MKTCDKCGRANPDDAVFCTGCGQGLADGTAGAAAAGAAAAGDAAAGDAAAGEAPANFAGPVAAGAAAAQTPGPAFDAPAGEAASAASMDPQRKRQIAIVAAIAVAAVVLVVVLVIALSGSSKTTIDVTEGVALEFAGANGYGTASLVGEDGWWDEAYAVLEEEYDSGSDEDYLMLFASAINLGSAVSFELSDSDGLSNGDTVTVTVSIDEELVEDMPLKLTGSDLEFEVSGLAEAEEIDVFDYVSVSFSGFSPYASVEVSYTGPDIGVEFVCDSDGELANGDTAVVTAVYDEETVGEAGYVVERDMLAFDVSDVDEVQEIDLFDYLVVSYEGFAPDATASVSDVTFDQLDELGISSCVDFELEGATELSNGDVITATVECDEDELLSLGYVAEDGSREIEVSGAEELQTVDVFDCLVVEYESYAPYASVSIDSGETNSALRELGLGDYLGVYVTFSLEGDTTDLDNGDTFTAKAEYDEDELLALGFVVESDTAEIEVSGVEEVQVIDVFDCLVVEYESYAPYASVSIDSDETNSALRELGIKNYVTFSLEGTTTDLDNGDTFTAKAEYDEDGLLALGFVVEADTAEIEVSGVEEVQVVDVFADLKIEYSGYAPLAKASVSSDSYDTLYDLGIKYYVDLDCDATGLSNGDTFTVTADVNEESLLKLGYVVEKTSKTITVSGLTSYYTILSDIPEEAMEEMEEQIESEFDSYVAAQWDDNEELEEFELLGCYLLTPKYLDNASDYRSLANRIVFVYRVSLTVDDEDYGGEVTYYTAYYFDDIFELADGTYSIDLDGCGSLSNSYSFAARYSYRGYETLDSLFSDYVTAYVDDYNYESTVEEEE